MAVGGDIGIDVEVVAHRVARYQSMEIGRDLQVGERLTRNRPWPRERGTVCTANHRVFFGPAIETEARQRWIAVGAGNIAEDFVVGTVLSNDEEAVLEMRKRRAIGDVGGIGGENCFCRFVRGGKAVDGNCTQTAVLKRANVGGGFRIVACTGVGPCPLAFGVHDVERFTVRR